MLHTRAQINVAMENVGGMPNGNVLALLQDFVKSANKWECLVEMWKPID
jgi:hypothetical protein